MIMADKETYVRFNKIKTRLPGPVSIEVDSK